MSALDLTLAGVTRALSPARTALDRAIADMPGRIRRTRIAQIKRGARDLIRDRWRLTRLFADHESRPLDALIAEAKVRIGGMIAARRSGNDWWVNGDTLMALMQAQLALRFVRRFGEEAGL